MKPNYSILVKKDSIFPMTAEDHLPGIVQVRNKHPEIFTSDVVKRYCNVVQQALWEIPASVQKQVVRIMIFFNPDDTVKFTPEKILP